MNLKHLLTSAYKKVVEKMDSLRVADAISEVFAIFKRCNKYIDETEPWVLGKDENKKTGFLQFFITLLKALQQVQAFLNHLCQILQKRY